MVSRSPEAGPRPERSTQMSAKPLTPPSPASLDTVASATTPAAGLPVSAWPDAMISSAKPRRTPGSGDGRGPSLDLGGRPHSWPGRSSERCSQEGVLVSVALRTGSVRAGEVERQGRQAVNRSLPVGTPRASPACSPWPEPS